MTSTGKSRLASGGLQMTKLNAQQNQQLVAVHMVASIALVLVGTVFGGF